MSDTWSMLPRGKRHGTMLITVNKQTVPADAATAASVLPCRHSVDETRRSGYVLAGRCAR